MTPFELLEPASLKDAIALIDPDDPTVRPMAGGTALMLMMKAGVFAPTRLISLGKIGDALTRIETKDGALAIGAMTTLSKVEHSADVAKYAPVIVHTMKRLSNVRVRNVATIGGNLAHGDPHMDLPPVLIALGASVRTAATKGGRELMVEDLLTDYYETALERDELIASLRIPAQGKARAAYLKVTTGSADDWPALGVAVSLDMDGDKIKTARVVASAATPMAIRLKGAENVLTGKAVDDKTLKAAGDAACDEAEMVADVRGSAAYKRELLRIYIGRAVRAAQQADAKP
ncbi:MAG TPA: xanthine dehydrogenase family protein subunit M [Pseudolabrys sp.]|nr:xanthine dehydrogenase family protein subunit M [Pseudolabrys sp.]